MGIRLQWGHGDEAVEEGDGTHQFTITMNALQWGHGDEAVEERRCTGPAGSGCRRLQWGHGDEAVEEFAPRAPGREHGLRFNGATAMKPWKR